MENKLDNLLKEIIELKSTVASKNDVARVQERISEIEKTQRDHSAVHSDIQKRLSKLENHDMPGQDHMARRPRPLGKPEGNPRGGGEDFKLARRSLTVSPANPTVDGIRNFFVKSMEMPNEVAEDMEISGIKRIHPRNLPKHRQKESGRKVKFMLADSYERDLAISYSTNLKGEDKVEIVVPDGLLSLRSQLESIAFRLRKHSEKSGGVKITTSLRLDDRSESLKLAVKEKKEDGWLYYSLDELKQLESTIVGAPEEDKER